MQGQWTAVERYLTDPGVQHHFQFIKDADVAFARQWGMRVAVEDLRRVVTAARHHPDG